MNMFWRLLVWAVLLGPLSFVCAQADSLLRARLDTIVKHNLPRGAAAGICIYDLSAGRTLYEHQADKLSRPASTMKVMTAITALAQSGAMEPFRTELWTTGRVAGDTLRGDLYVVGGFDPTCR